MIGNTDAYWFRSMKIDNLSFPEFLSKVDEGIERGSYVCFVEASSVALANRDQELMTALNDSFMSLPDGMPLVWFSRLLGSRKMVRMPGPEVFRDFVENRGKYRQFLVGDTPERIQAVIDKATEVNPALQISGYSPPFRRELSEEDNAAIIDRIRAEAPDIIWVALGLVKQAKWMHKMAPRLDRGIMMGVGAALKFYTGEIPTPPLILQKAGLHWVSRMVDKPRSFFTEIIPARIKFMLYFPAEIIRESMRRRSRPSSRRRGL